MSSQKQATSEALLANVRQTLRTVGAAREGVLQRFRLAGGSLTRWTQGDVRLMADAMTRTEDEFEGKRGGATGLREVRRELENYGWTK